VAISLETSEKSPLGEALERKCDGKVVFSSAVAAAETREKKVCGRSPLLIRLYRRALQQTRPPAAAAAAAAAPSPYRFSFVCWTWNA